MGCSPGIGRTVAVIVYSLCPFCLLKTCLLVQIADLQVCIGLLYEGHAFFYYLMFENWRLESNFTQNFRLKDYAGFRSLTCTHAIQPS